MLKSCSQKRRDSQAILYAESCVSVVISSFTSEAKSASMRFSTLKGMVQMQKSAVTVSAAPDFASSFAASDAASDVASAFAASDFASSFAASDAAASEVASSLAAAGYERTVARGFSDSMIGRSMSE